MIVNAFCLFTVLDDRSQAENIEANPVAEVANVGDATDAIVTSIRTGKVLDTDQQAYAHPPILQDVNSGQDTEGRSIKSKLCKLGLAREVMQITLSDN